MLLATGILLSSCAPTIGNGRITNNFGTYMEKMAELFDSKPSDPTVYCKDHANEMRILSIKDGNNYLYTFEINSNTNYLLTMERINKYAILLAPSDGEMTSKWTEIPRGKASYSYAEWVFEPINLGTPNIAYAVMKPEGRNAVICASIIFAK